MDVQKAMKHCTKIWNEYYILKMDIRKYFQNINKDILMNILRKKVKEEKLMYLSSEKWPTQPPAGFSVGAKLEVAGLHSNTIPDGYFYGSSPVIY